MIGRCQNWAGLLALGFALALLETMFDRETFIESERGHNISACRLRQVQIMKKFSSWVLYTVEMVMLKKYAI